MKLLVALEDVVASHVNRSEVLLTALQSGEEPKSITTALEHAMDALDTLLSTTPRKERAAVKALCERTEAALEAIDATVMRQLSLCEASDLSSLVECLCGVESLVVGEVERQSCHQTVSEALDELQRCSDPVAGAARMVESADAEVRQRGLMVLRGLERVVLLEAAAAEVELIPVLQAVALDTARSCAERQAASLATFAVGIRNVEAAAAALLEVQGPPSMAVAAVLEELYQGQLDGRVGVRVAAAQFA